MKHKGVIVLEKNILKKVMKEEVHKKTWIILKFYNPKTREFNSIITQLYLKEKLHVDSCYSII